MLGEERKKKGLEQGSGHDTACFGLTWGLRRLFIDERIDLKMRTPAKGYPSPHQKNSIILVSRHELQIFVFIIVTF